MNTEKMVSDTPRPSRKWSAFGIVFLICIPVVIWLLGAELSSMLAMDWKAKGSPANVQTLAPALGMYAVRIGAIGIMAVNIGKLLRGPTESTPKCMVVRPAQPTL